MVGQKKFAKRSIESTVTIDGIELVTVTVQCLLFRLVLELVTVTVQCLLFRLVLGDMKNHGWACS